MREKWTNKVHVEGYLFNFGSNERRGLQKKVTGPNSKVPGTTYLQGEINIATDDEGLNVVTVFIPYLPENASFQAKKDTYSVLSELLEDGSTFEKDGTEAPKLRIDGNVALNEFVDKEGNIASPKRIEGAFVHKMRSNEEISTDRASRFELDMIIAGAMEQEVEGGEDYLKLRGYVFNFKNDIMPIDLSVQGKNGIEYFLKQDISNSNPLVTKVWGNIISTVLKTENVIESAFGAPEVRVSTRTIKSWDIVGASEEPMIWDDESSITKKELKDCLQKRETYLAELKKRNEEYLESRKNEGNAFKTASAPAPKAKATVVEEEDDDDFPF